MDYFSVFYTALDSSVSIIILSLSLVLDVCEVKVFVIIFL